MDPPIENDTKPWIEGGALLTLIFKGTKGKKRKDDERGGKRRKRKERGGKTMMGSGLLFVQLNLFFVFVFLPFIFFSFVFDLLTPTHNNSLIVLH